MEGAPTPVRKSLIDQTDPLFFAPQVKRPEVDPRQHGSPRRETSAYRFSDGWLSFLSHLKGITIRGGNVCPILQRSA